MKICFASNNPNKIKELNDMLGSSYKIIGLKDLGVKEDIPETGSTLEENSTIKAQYIFERFKIPVFADDSGLMVTSLNGEPGVFSARYAGPEKNDEKNIDLLLKNLGGAEDRRASFETVITLIQENGRSFQFKGTVDGHIISEKRGTNGFGYDPIFVPEGHKRTFAEMTSDQKNALSHRNMAVKQLITHLQSAL